MSRPFPPLHCNYEKKMSLLLSEEPMSRNKDQFIVPQHKERAFCFVFLETDSHYVAQIQHPVSNSQQTSWFSLPRAKIYRHAQLHPTVVFLLMVDLTEFHCILSHLLGSQGTFYFGVLFCLVYECVCVGLHMYTHTSVECIWVCLSVCGCTCEYICVCLWICTHECIWLCLCVCTR